MLLLSISEKFLLFISGFGITQSALLASLLIFYPTSDRSVNKFLAFYICSFIVPMMMPVSQHLFFWQFIIFLEPFTLVIGPFLYLYVRGFKEVITWRKAWPHFVLFVLFLPLAGWVFNDVGKIYPLSKEIPAEVPSHLLSIIPVTIRLLQRIIYFFLARKELLVYQKSIRHLFSETSRIDLNWVKWLIYGYLFLTIGTIVGYSMILKYPEYFKLWVLIVGSLNTVYIYAATFKGMKQSTVWQLQGKGNKESVEIRMKEAESLEQDKVSHEKQKYQRSTIGVDRLQEITDRIVQALAKEKLFLEAELNLQNLADRLNLPSYQVSQAINETLGKNFYDVVNGYRVEEAKRLLADPKNRNYTVLSVGFEAGFNSKTTFNTVFKKFTGQTPSDFKLKHATSLVNA